MFRRQSGTRPREIRQNGETRAALGPPDRSEAGHVKPVGDATRRHTSGSAGGAEPVTSAQGPDAQGVALFQRAGGPSTKAV